MKKSQFAEEPIAWALHQHEGGMSVAGVTRRLGSRSKYSTGGRRSSGAPSEVHRLKDLEGENVV